MRMIESITVTPGMLTTSNIPENDAPAWSGSVTYALGAEVIQNHRVYKSVQDDNTNHSPSGDALSTWWLDIGATNRWRAFDGLLTPLASIATANINYVITLNSEINSVSLFGLIGDSVQVTVRDGANVIQYDENYPINGGRVVTNWWEYFFAPFVTTPTLIVYDVPGFIGWTVQVQVIGSGTRSVGEILLGTNIVLGDTLNDTTTGIQDFSIKERDQFGGWRIVERGYSNTVDFRFSLPSEDVSRVKRVIARNRARMCVFSAGPGTDIYGTTVVGFVNTDGLSIPITTNNSYATLSVEGLTED